MIAGPFMDSYSAHYGNTFGGKDVKIDLSVTQIQQNGEGDWSLTHTTWITTEVWTRSCGNMYNIPDATEYMCVVNSN